MLDRVSGQDTPVRDIFLQAQLVVRRSLRRRARPEPALAHRQRRVFFSLSMLAPHAIKCARGDPHPAEKALRPAPGGAPASMSRPISNQRAGKRQIVQYRRGAVVYAQGDAGADVRYVQKGTIKLSVLSSTGKEAVVAMLSAGDFFGEGALAGQGSAWDRHGR
jgi:hypothetical protein